MHTLAVEYYCIIFFIVNNNIMYVRAYVIYVCMHTVCILLLVASIIYLEFL